MEKQFKSLEFIYQDMQIHFLVNPHDNNVMINATEMAKVFDKKTELFLKSDHAKAFIEVANRQPNGWQIMENRGRNGIYFNKILALKFAAWLSPEFEFWVFSTIDNIVFGNYKKHWEAHQKQEDAKLKLALLKDKLLKEVPELAIPFFEAEKIVHDSRSEKQKALQNQYKIDLFKD